MHYHKSKFLRFANAAFEFLLLILTFILAGWLRSYTPMGSQFFMWDIWTFLPISALYALVIVGCNAVLGSYRTLHLRNSIKQLFLIALTSLMGLALMATAFYVFRVSQLSRRPQMDPKVIVNNYFFAYHWSVLRTFLSLSA